MEKRKKKKPMNEGDKGKSEETRRPPEEEREAQERGTCQSVL